MSLDSVTEQQFPGENGIRFNVAIKNIGNAIALNEATIVAGKLLPAILPQQRVDAYMKKIRNMMSDYEKQGPNHVQLPPPNGRVVTLFDIDTLLENKQPSVILATSAQLQDFNNGKTAIYVFFVSDYEDETIEGRAFWESEGCAFYLATFAYYHTCSPLVINKIERARFR